MQLSGRTRTLAVGAALLAVSLLAVASRFFSPEDYNALQVLFEPVANVQREPFEIYVTASAELDSAQSVLLSSELPSNRAKAVFLATEGELVEAGDVVARFDATSFREDLENIDHEIREQQIKLQQANADLSLHATGSEDRAAELQHDIEVARLKLSSLEQANIPIRVAQAEKEVRRSAADLERARKLRDTERELFAKGLTPQKSLDEAEVDEKDAASAHALAVHQLKVLNQVTLPSERRQAQLQLENSQREVEVFRKTQEDNLKKLKAAAAQVENRIAALQTERERTLRYIEQTELRAPVSGIVLYKTIPIQGEKRKVQVGDSMWNRQAFAVIPDLSSMVAQMNVSETEVGKLRPGQKATVRPAAYPNLELSGSVESVGTLAAEEGNQQERYFRVRIALDATDVRLRPGMSARAAVLVETFDEAVLVPVEAVFYHRQQPVVFLWRGGQPLRVPVRLGLSDGERVVVEAGVEPGQQVMLVYPDSFEASADAEG